MQELFDQIELRGVRSLTDSELLTLVVGEQALAEHLLHEYGSLARLVAEERSRLRMVGGLGLKRARQLHLAAELGRRVAEQQPQTAQVVSSSEDVVALMRPQLDQLPHEECWALYLTSSNRLIERQRISQGGVQGTIVDHRLVVKRALELLATKLILVHNHPSGMAEPSGQDRQITQRLKEAAALFDIRLLDHLIIAREGDFSFKRAGLL
ncbi:MAG: DNA repair protein RadC [Alistipes sp.]|nr:DNA repair protein RadC [Alistipes sp.]